VLRKLSSHLCECTHFFKSLTSSEVSSLLIILHMPVINQTFQTYTAKNTKITVLSDLAPCDNLYGKTNDSMHQKAVILVQKSQ